MPTSKTTAKKRTKFWSRFKNPKFRNITIAVVAGLVVLTSGVVVYVSQAYTECVYRYFRLGSYDPCVGYIQSMVNYMSPANKAIGVDRDFGPQTKGTSYPYGGVLYVQRRNGILVDGIVGPQTWKVLCDQGNHAADSSVSYHSYSFQYDFEQAGCAVRFKDLPIPK